jgi:trk system potassium uptake protein
MKTKFINRLSPTQIIALGFLITIFIGSLILKLPISRSGELSYKDAIYTATSCTCVTGLATVDIENTFTLFGKIIIMILMQIGGLRFYACYSTYYDVATAKK